MTRLALMLSVLLVAPSASAQERTPLLHALYGNAVTLQGLDAYLTLRAVQTRDFQETNGLMAPMVERPIAWLAMKAATSIATVQVADHLWMSGRKKTAIATLIATNGLMSIVVARNAALLRRRA